MCWCSAGSDLEEASWSYQDLTKKSTYRWCKEVQDGKIVENIKPTGRTTKEQDERIVEKVAHEPMKPVTQHKKELESEGIVLSEYIM